MNLGEHFLVIVQEGVFHVEHGLVNNLILSDGVGGGPRAAYALGRGLIALLRRGILYTCSVCALGGGSSEVTQGKRKSASIQHGTYANAAHIVNSWKRKLTNVGAQHSTSAAQSIAHRGILFPFGT